MSRNNIDVTRLNTALWLFFSFLACVYFALSYNANPDYLNMAAYTQGLSPTPYQYRALPMFVFRALVDLPLVNHIANRAPSQFHSPYQIVQLGISLLSMLGCVLASYGTLKRLTNFDLQFSRWTSLLVVYMAYFTLVPGWGLDYTYPYDTPSLFFFCMGIYLVVSGERWKIWLYYAMFPIAVLNRETACFMTIFFIIWEWQKSRAGLNRTARIHLAIHIVAQAAIWVAVKHALGHTFAANVAEGELTGTYFEGKLLFNLRELGPPQQWPVLLSCGGFLFPALFLGRKWIKNPGIEWACMIILPLWFAGMMLVGLIIEIRVFSETVAFTALALALIIYNRFYLPANHELNVARA